MLLLIISLTALAAWLWLFLAHGGYWRAGERLDPAPDPPRWPSVVAVIPARDEAASIEPVIKAHLAAEYPGAFSVVLVDDHSTDGTAELARRAAASAPQRLDIIDAPSLAPGWTGKLNAVHAGLEEAARVAPDADYVLLTDADIVPAPSTLRRLVAKSEYDNVALASLMARLDARGLWGGLLIPAFVYFFQKLYPFPLSNDPASPIAAAAGGCMLVRREELKRAGGIETIKGELIDDCALARAIKRSAPGKKIWIGLARDEAVSLRDNRSLASIWSMVERTAFVQLDQSWAKLAGAVLGMSLLYLAPALIVVGYPWHGDSASAAIAGAAWVIMAASYFPTARLYDQSGWKTALLPIAGLLYAMMTVSSGVKHLRGRGGAWKGRTY